MAKTNTRVTVDIPTVDHKKLKILAAYHGKSMREIFVELIERGLEEYLVMFYFFKTKTTTGNQSKNSPSLLSGFSEIYPCIT